MRKTDNFNLTQYESGDITSYLTHYNEDNTKIDTALKGISDKTDGAITDIENIIIDVDSLDGKVSAVETSLQTVIKNVSDNTTRSTKALSQSISQYSHQKIGIEHFITLDDGTQTDNIKFIATSDFTKGDSFKINNQLVIAQTVNGELLPTGYFKNNTEVFCILNGNILTFMGYFKDVGFISNSKQIMLVGDVNVSQGDGLQIMYNDDSLKQIFGDDRVTFSNTHVTVMNNSFSLNSISITECLVDDDLFYIRYVNSNNTIAKLSLLITVNI